MVIDMGEKAAEFRAKGFLAIGLVYSLKATDGKWLLFGFTCYCTLIRILLKWSNLLFLYDRNVFPVLWTVDVLIVCLSLCLCVSLASLRSMQEDYQRKALGAFQRLGLSHVALLSVFCFTPTFSTQLFLTGAFAFFQWNKMKSGIKTQPYKNYPVSFDTKYACIRAICALRTSLGTHFCPWTTSFHKNVLIVLLTVSKYLNVLWFDFFHIILLCSRC